jgi:glucose/galactose transporter
LVALAAYISYFVLALPSAYILKLTGYRKGIVLGLVIMAVGTFLFVPAAYSRTYPIFLTGLFITGSGLALLQTAANPYVAIIGPMESTAQRIGFMGLANKIAGILSLSLLGSIFLFNADEIIASVSQANAREKAVILNAYALKIVKPYIIITAILLLLAVLIYFSKMPEINESETEMTDHESHAKSKLSVLQYPHLVLGVVALFFAAACEGIPIDCIIIYSRALGIPIEEARHFSTYTLYAMLAGYIASTVLIPKYLSQSKALQACACLGIALTIGAYLSSAIVSIICLILMGFGAAMLWGTIWGLSLKELGKHTKIGSAMLLMSVIGGGIFPMLFGGLIDKNQSYPQNSVLLLLPCYLVLWFFSVKGHRMKRWNSKPKHGLQPAYKIKQSSL